MLTAELIELDIDGDMILLQTGLESFTEIMYANGNRLENQRHLQMPFPLIVGIEQLFDGFGVFEGAVVVLLGAFVYHLEIFDQAD